MFAAMKEVKVNDSVKGACGPLDERDTNAGLFCSRARKRSVSREAVQIIRTRLKMLLLATVTWRALLQYVDDHSETKQSARRQV